MSAPIAVTSGNFEKEVLQSDAPVMVDFWAAWCGPCRAIAPAVEDVARRYAGRLKVCKLDVEAEPALADKHNVQGIPCIVFYKGGVEVERHVGLTSADALSELADRVLQG